MTSSSSKNDGASIIELFWCFDASGFAAAKSLCAMIAWLSIAAGKTSLVSGIYCSDLATGVSMNKAADYCARDGGRLLPVV